MAGLAGFRAAAPANDNFANAQLLVGDYGTIYATNTSATAETGEPSHAGLKPANTLWYQWVANASAPVEFDTINSQCDTVLAVYIIGPGAATNLSNLSLVVANDDLNPNNPQNANRYGSSSIGDPYQVNPCLGPSAVKFTAVRGTTYFIAVGGTHKDKSSLPGTGLISLSWAYQSAGVFRFTCSSWSRQPNLRYGMQYSHNGADYWCAETESRAPQDGTYSESARGAVVTITRLLGSCGRVAVGFELLNGDYAVTNANTYRWGDTNAYVIGTGYGPYAYLYTNNDNVIADYKWPTFPNTSVIVTNIIFDDREVTKSLIIPILDDQNLVPGQDWLDSGLCTARGGIGPYTMLATNTFYIGTNVIFNQVQQYALDPSKAVRFFYVVLTNATSIYATNSPDGLGEDASVVAPPRLDTGVTNGVVNDHCLATVGILDMDYYPFVNPVVDTNILMLDGQPGPARFTSPTA